MKLNVLEGVGEMLRATAAAIVMPRFALLEAGEIELKATNEPVTVADREAEAAIGKSLRSIHPSARVVGEEACHADPTLLKDLDDGLVWIIDPIDGTANFAAGRPPFAMMVALLQHGETIGSWILDPLSGQLAVAEKGSGAWIDGERVRTSPEANELGSLEGIVSTAFIPSDHLGLPDKLGQAVRIVHPTARCAGHEYPLVATGSRDFALYWRTLVWDHAPGALLLNEAGGSVTHLDGAPYQPTQTRPGLLLAHNPLIAQALLGAIEAKI